MLDKLRKIKNNFFYYGRRKCLLWKHLAEQYLIDHFKVLFCFFCCLTVVLFFFTGFFLLVNPAFVLFKLPLSRDLLFFLFLLSIFFFILLFIVCCLKRDKMPDAKSVLTFIVVTASFSLVLLCIFFGFWFLYTHILGMETSKFSITIPKRLLYFLYLLFVCGLSLNSVKVLYFVVYFDFVVAQGLKAKDALFSSILKFCSIVGSFCFLILIITYFDFGVVSTESFFFYFFKVSKVYWTENQLFHFAHDYIVNSFDQEIAKRILDLLPELISQCENNINSLQLKIDALAVKFQPEPVIVPEPPSKISLMFSYFCYFAELWITGWLFIVELEANDGALLYYDPL